jgi:hypothetical protein
MAEIRTVTTLRAKRDDIEKSIANYEKRLAQAQSDLSHINAAISIFEASGDPKGFPAYVDIALCKQALAAGPMTTPQLALYVMKAKGLDLGDKVLAKSIGFRLIHSLRQQSLRGNVVILGKHKAARIWELPPIKTLV